jgi:hypothetical protein
MASPRLPVPKLTSYESGFAALKVVVVGVVQVGAVLAGTHLRMEMFLLDLVAELDPGIGPCQELVLGVDGEPDPLEVDRHGWLLDGSGSDV